MDSHILPTPDLDRTGLSAARLPGEPDPDSFMSPRDDERLPSAVRSRSGRRSGLISATVFVLVPVMAFGAFVLSPYNHVVPVPAKVTAQVHRLATEAGLSRDPPILAPAASLASIQLPTRPDAVMLDPYQPKPRGEALAELLSMRPDRAGPGPAEPDAPTPKNKPVAVMRTPAPHPLPPSHESSPDVIPGEPGALAGRSTAQTERAIAQPDHPATTTSPTQADITSSVISAATGSAPAAGSPVRDVTANLAPIPPTAPPQPAPVGAPDAPAVVAALPSDPVQQALLPRPAPMTEERQIEVLQLVTQMATVLHNLQTENAALRSDVSRRSGEMDARLRDFERRINLAEARRAVDAATTVHGAEPIAPTGPAASASPPTVRSIAVTSAAMVLPTDTARKRYRVQAASPGLALLAEIDRGGGDGAQVQIIVGDALPGWGKVKSIAQRGTSWVVATEHGNID